MTQKPNQHHLSHQPTGLRNSPSRPTQTMRVFVLHLVGSPPLSKGTALRPRSITAAVNATTVPPTYNYSGTPTAKFGLPRSRTSHQSTTTSTKQNNTVSLRPKPGGAITFVQSVQPEMSQFINRLPCSWDVSCHTSPDGISNAASNAAWMRRSTTGGLACMRKTGFTQDDINTILWDEDPNYTVFRPFSKHPPNNRGLGSPEPTPSTTIRIKPPLIIRAYMATFTRPVSTYTFRYAALKIPPSEAPLSGMLRPYNALLDNNTHNNSNKPFRKRMIALLREGQKDAISVWNIYTSDQLTAHDKLCKELEAEQQLRQTNKPSPWQERQSAEQSQRPSLHHFAAVSDSGTWCNPPSSSGKNPVVPFPLPNSPHTIFTPSRPLPPEHSLPLGGLSFAHFSSLAPSNTFLASSHNIPASSNPPIPPNPWPSQKISHLAK